MIFLQTMTVVLRWGGFDIIEMVLKTDEKFIKKYNGCLPSKLPLFRCMLGDSSDNIKGIPFVFLKILHYL